MATNAKSTMATGSSGAYQWLTTSKHDLGSLLAACPQAVLDKYLAITSFDSGSLVLNQEETASRWESRNGIAYSPKIQSVEKLPQGGFDEWYVFNAPADLGQLFQGNVFERPLRAGNVAAFVNFGGFSLNNLAVQALVDLFWPQLESIHPESFIADGHFLNFVSRDHELFAAVRTALR
jgi:hypothetical protein